MDTVANHTVTNKTNFDIVRKTNKIIGRKIPLINVDYLYLQNSSSKIKRIGIDCTQITILRNIANVFVWGCFKGQFFNVSTVPKLIY